MKRAWAASNNRSTKQIRGRPGQVMVMADGTPPLVRPHAKLLPIPEQASS